MFSSHTRRSEAPPPRLLRAYGNRLSSIYEGWARLRIEGWVRFGNRGWKHEHTWMIIGGKVFDPSLVQFEQLQAFPNPLHRLQERGIPVREYRRAWRAAFSPWWIDRCRSFGVSPWSMS